MRRLVPLCVLLGAAFATHAAADSITFGTAHATTSGTFNCFNIMGCSASGGTVTFGSGSNAVTWTFTGAELTFPVSNATVPISLGTITSSSAGDRYPSGINPNIPFVQLVFEMRQDAPAGGVGRLWLSFGPGGESALPFMQGNTYMGMNPGSVAPGYNSFVYTLSPDTFFVPLNGSLSLTANVGAVPEPGTMILVGSGLLVAWRARRRTARAGERRSRFS